MILLDVRSPTPVDVLFQIISTDSRSHRIKSLLNQTHPPQCLVTNMQSIQRWEREWSGLRDNAPSLPCLHVSSPPWDSFYHHHKVVAKLCTGSRGGIKHARSELLYTIVCFFRSHKVCGILNSYYVQSS